MSEFFSWQRLVNCFPKLIRYLPVTFEIVGLSAFTGILLGTVIAAVRIRRVPIIDKVCAVFISFMRGTPMLVQMLVSYYAIPLVLEKTLGIDSRRWPKIVFVYITFALNQGAFLSEMIRSSILAIPQGQTEAGLACGLTSFQTFFRIIIPQASRIALPSVSLDVVGLFQETSLVYMVGVIDIMGRAQTIATQTGHVLECYVIIAFIFVLISILLRLIFKRIEGGVQYGRTTA
jgi:His/Glu/Gln/Arg/opine family amino acid ABC transporter permease subunit